MFDELERATSMYSCHGVFTDQFIFRTVVVQILKTYRPKSDIFCLLIKFSFPL